MPTPVAMDYASMEMEQQSAIMQNEPNVGSALIAKAKMWENVLREIKEAETSVGTAADTVEPGWTSADGKLFVQRNRDTQSVLGDWAGKIEGAGIPAAYNGLMQPIRDASQKVVGRTASALNQIKNLQALVPPPPDLAQQIQKIRDDTKRDNAADMQGLDTQYRAVIGKLEAAVSGRGWEQANPRQQSPTSTSPGGPSAEQQQDGGAQEGGEQSGGGAEQQQAGAQAGGAEQGGAQQEGGAGQEGALPPGVDPSLSGGLGSSPVVPPTMPPGAVPPGAVPPPVSGPGVTPFVPMGGFGGGLRGGSGGGGGGGGIGGGVRVGPTQIPTAATPVSTAVPPTPGAAPAMPAPAAPGGAGTTGGGGGIPPMMPPMGGGMGAAAGAGGSGPGGPGGNNRPRERRRDNDKTPGLPALLSGKAGTSSSYAFTRNRAAEWDTPATVQLIDEDLWQVDDKQAAVEQPAPVRRVRR